MNHDDIIRMAREANMPACHTTHPKALERFAELVRADEREKWMERTAILIRGEREACAKVCDELHWPWHMGDNSGPKECAAAIRAREQA